MKVLLSLTAILAICHMTLAVKYNMTCYYDTSSINRGGKANFTINDLETSLQYCTHIVYGYVGIQPISFGLIPLDKKQHQQFSQVKTLKRKYPHVKFLLSLGGDKDLKQPDKYMQLLEAGANKQQQFIHSVLDFMQRYQFDGLDLAYQFPRNKPLTHHSQIGSAVKKVKKLFTGNFEVDKSTGRHKKEFSNLVYQLKTALKRQKRMLTLTVLPNVNTTWYFDVPAIIEHLDFVNLAAFDFSTPQRNPKEADFMAPISAPPRHDLRSMQSNVNYEVHQWLSQHTPSRKINVGIATFGRTWRMTKELKSSNMPIQASIDGPAPGGEKTHTPGLLSWPEICPKLGHMRKYHDKKYGNYAYRSADVKGQEGLLITYESPESAADKANYIQSHSLGGVALFDLSLDDFRGECERVKYPILKSIQYKLF